MILKFNTFHFNWINVLSENFITDSVGKNDANWEENSISSICFNHRKEAHVCPVFPCTGFLVCFQQSTARNIYESG